MKRKLFYLIAISGTLLTACNKDFLDRTPEDAYSNESLWTSEADARAALNGCYRDWEDSYNVIYMDCASDNAYSQFLWEGYMNIGNGSLTPSDGNVTNRWNFKTIQKCNWFLENVDKTPMDETLKTRFKAEARFLRAYQYYTLTQLYGDVPLVTNTLTPTEANAVTRTPVAEVQKYVLDELAAIAPQLEPSYSGADVGRITRGAAYALRARLELYMGNYAGCIEDCQKVMGLGYDLFRNTSSPAASYQDLFRIQNENNTEVILDMQYKENDYPNGNIGIMPTSSSGGWSSVDPTQALVDAYEMKNGKLITDPTSGYNANDPYANRDPRLSASIVYPGQMYDGKYYNPIDPASGDFMLGDNNSKTGYLPKKFISNLSDYTDMWNTGLNMIIIRYADVLLMYAESKIETGSIDATVYDALDKIRARAGMPVVDRLVYNSQPTLRTLVRRERRVELALEGLRWYDIKRWKIGDEVRKGNVYGARQGKVDANTGKVTFTADHQLVESRLFDATIHYVWPVPQKEIDINGKLSQNPNY
ncbi:RagB/SusD family nutrient uptake outer membrane protein [Chitinophaga sp. GCM10012297]|uniref:RagB/SusD family nutrient uptake outer membrane protein n=1 Tax=Chitinophaga chungangae TaxID=2821488 RepID=A0ABS3YC89_9BACT|nr:RagB/SusD family nutrient uptake outer membrane protein [Chitinophaga chungangae]MBO9152294.1 RagB/SusD family nutrient uptake outer membrane protein [Chitinophaga chungangae]